MTTLTADDLDTLDLVKPSFSSRQRYDGVFPFISHTR
jgi:hypothetical protein